MIGSSIHEPILKALELHPFGVVPTGTTGGPVQAPLYAVRLVLPILAWTVNIQVAGVDLTGQQVQTRPPRDIVGLLARNLRARCLMVRNGPGGFWTLATEP